MKDYAVYGVSQAEAWHEVLSKVNGADIYFTPEYGRLAENNGEGTSRLFVYREGDAVVCYPFLMRSLRELGLASIRQEGRELFDIISPYGYGGPIANVEHTGETEPFFGRFAEVFEAFCGENGIIAEFVRFHPLLNNYRNYPSVKPEYIRNTVHIDLTGPGTDVLDSLTAGCRNRVRYAQKHGVTVTREQPPGLDVFLNLYYATMDKNKANAYYYFSEGYFSNMLDFLRESADLFVTRLGGHVIASTFFLRYGDYVSYHLTGSDKEYLKYAPYNLLLTEAANWYKAQGCKYLHLGGGYTGNDELFRFKSTFNKMQPPLDFYIGRKIHCPVTYERICSGLPVKSDYFPAYRDPLLVKGEVKQM
ncbi:lipid II:glycine glycyltransferase FemX [Paenibacillus gansuensis]|uniref:Lipid II:glycine glycyltransferase FemX n=1 Tax=Paenibacillus gansuensis TaxID=306542 RepID=A0ABW5PHA5_9BACL